MEPIKPNIIFLDIDGVLNGDYAWRGFFLILSRLLHIEKIYDKIFGRSNKKYFFINERMVKILSNIVHKTDSEIVLISSWRKKVWKYYNNAELRESKSIASVPVKELIELFDKYDIHILDIAPEIDNRRDIEILTWLSKHEDIFGSFIILDDENYNYHIFDDKYICTSDDSNRTQYWYVSYGLRYRHIRKCLKAVKKQREV